MKKAAAKYGGTGIHLFLLALAAAFSWNSWNLHVMSTTPAGVERLREGVTIATFDDVSYLAPAETWRRRLKGENVEGRPGVRPPGYGLIYFFFRLFAPEPLALRALALFQVLLFAFSVVLLWHSLVLQGIRARLATAVCAGLAVLPGFSGFLFYTLTEGVTPALVLICVSCAMLLGSDGRKRWLILGTLAWALLNITRPVLLWAGLPLLLVCLRTRPALHGLGVMLFALLPLAGWWTGQSLERGEPVSLHPVYHPGNTNVFRPPHAAFWDLAKSWGMSGEEFHRIMVPGFEAALACDTTERHTNLFLANAPAHHLNEDQQARIREAFRRWQRSLCTTLAPLVRSGTTPSRIAEEDALATDIRVITAEYRRDHPWHHHIVVPAMVMRQLVVHSNLNLYMFQHSFRGRPLMEALRVVSLLIHIFLILVPLVILFAPSIPVPIRTAALCATFYLLLLAYWQRGVEERYTLPILHLAVLLLPFLVQRMARHASGQ
jgi:hypothetical protein